MNSLKLGFKYYRKIMPVAIICQIMGLVAIFIGTLAPLIAQMLIDCVLAYNPSAELKINPIFSFLVGGNFGEMGSMRLFYSISLTLIIAIFLRVILIYIRNNIYMRNGFRFENQLRKLTYRKLLSIDNSALSRYQTGNLLNILNSDIISFRDLFVFLTMVILDAVFMLVCIAVWLGEINLYLLIIPLALIPVMIIVLNRYIKAAKVVSLKIRNKSADLNQTVEEGINGVRLIKAYTNEKHEYEKFAKQNDEMHKYYDEQVLLQSKFNLIFNLIRQVAYVGSIGIASYLVISGSLTTGYLLTCASYVASIMTIITSLNNYCYMFQQNLVCGDKIRDFLAEKDTPEHQSVEKVDNFDIKLKNVSLVADGVDILKNINLEIPYGTSLGIMGETGSGKTVLLKTLTRILPVTSGEILLGNKNIDDIPLNTLRSEFSYVFQDVFLFSNTIDANIAFSNPDLPTEAVVAAAKDAKAHSFISTLPEGYNTIVGEKGLGLSGGQRQRISIARALIKNAPILVLDDATSALDRTTESDIFETIKTKYPHKTLIISTHKVSACKDCDLIIYMTNGQISEMGTFEQLLNKNGLFAKVYKEQVDEVDE